MTLRDLLSPRQRLLELETEIGELRRELATLKAQNESMRQGMRRCVTCDYRIEFKQRQDEHLANPD